ncbi:unnamed protein product [Staurois parvus]|uniref:Uncharacterized protein n=1 Tax=Staurois parvus TaxID=386267 RepID=A0ABN9DZ61_9NEOB|nr:unnamed protein product [Staurois parvus]
MDGFLSYHPLYTIVSLAVISHSDHMYRLGQSQPIRVMGLAVANHS